MFNHLPVLNNRIQIPMDYPRSQSQIYSHITRLNEFVNFAENKFYQLNKEIKNLRINNEIIRSRTKRVKKTHTFFEEFDQYVLMEIFKYLDVYDIFNLRLVTKRIKEIIECDTMLRMIKKYYIKDFPYTKDRVNKCIRFNELYDVFTDLKYIMRQSESINIINGIHIFNIDILWFEIDIAYHIGNIIFILNIKMDRGYICNINLRSDYNANITIKYENHIKLEENSKSKLKILINMKKRIIYLFRFRYDEYECIHEFICGEEVKIFKKNMNQLWYKNLT